MGREKKIINKELSDKEIMQKLLDKLRYSALAFANELGYKSHSTIHHILNERNNISEDLIDKIIKKFPQVNFWFLKKGQEPILMEPILKQNDANLFNSEIQKGEPNYNLEMFLTLKKIEKLLEKIVDIQSNK